MKLLVIHGPNLNRLGEREVDIYGTLSLDDINAKITDYAGQKGITTHFFQSNHEGEIVDKIHEAPKDGTTGIILNGAAYSHTSVAIRDALASVELPKIEVHLSNIHAREEFRNHSYSAAVCKGIISGFGPNSYLLAVDAFALES